MLVIGRQWFIYFLAGGLCVFQANRVNLGAAESTTGSDSGLQLSDSGASKASLREGESDLWSGDKVRLLREGDSLGGAISLPSAPSPMPKRSANGRERGLRSFDWLSSESESSGSLPTAEELLSGGGFSSWIGNASGSTFGGGEAPAVTKPSNRAIDRSYDSADGGLDSLLIDSVVGGSVLDDRLMRESILSQSVLGAPRSITGRDQTGALNSTLRAMGRQTRSSADPQRSSLGLIEDPMADLFELPGLAGSDPSVLFEDSTRVEINPVTPDAKGGTSLDGFGIGSAQRRTGEPGTLDLHGGFLQGRNEALGRSSLSPSIMPERKVFDSRDRRIDFRNFPERKF